MDLLVMAVRAYLAGVGTPDENRLYREWNATWDRTSDLDRRHALLYFADDWASKL